MKYLSLRIQIFLLVALSVLAVAAASFRSTWTFLLQDKLASLRELQTLSLVTTLQDMRTQSQDLREELRSLAVGLYKNSSEVGRPFFNIKSSKGNYTWSQVVLSPVASMASNETYQQTQQDSAPVTASQVSRSLLFDPQEILRAPLERGPASAQESAPASSSIKQQWSYNIVKAGNDFNITIEDPLTLGQDGNQYVLRGEVSAQVLASLINNIQFQSIDVQLYTQDASAEQLTSILGSMNAEDTYKTSIQKELADNQLSKIEGRSISVQQGDQQSFVSFSKLRLANADSNILLAFVAEESKLVGEFRAFLAEQVFILLSILVGALLAGYFVTRLITKPIAELVKATRELEKGHFQQRVEIVARNEIGKLASAFNHLGKSLQDREDALASAESNMRQLSFQTIVFKRLTDFTDKIAKILNPEELQDAVMQSWSDLLNVSPDGNHLAFYQFDPTTRRHVLLKHNEYAQGFPQELGPELWNQSLSFSSETYEVTDPESLAVFSLEDTRDRIFRLPIIGENKIYGILVFTAIEVQDTEYFEMLMIECQRLISTSFESANRYAVLQETSIRDGLTGLFNVRFFKECLEKEMIRSHQTQEPVSFLFFDVDHFKKYNDTHGHPAGDRVLKQLASLMRSSFDTKDVVARYGGEEFVVLLKNTPHEEALLHAERFRALVEESKFENEHTQPLGFVSISIGVSTSPDHAEDMSNLIKLADDALYQAKKTSRNLVVSANLLADQSENSAA